MPCTDTESEPTPDVTYDTPVNQRMADISTLHGASDAQSPEINSDALKEHVNIQSTGRQHELHGSAGQSQITANNGTESFAVFPTISPSDYISDEEFGNMYQYLKYDTLTGNARPDKTTLIMAERYLIDEEGLLYRIETPRQKKLEKLKPIMKRLCIPRRFRHDIMAYFHDQCGHYCSDMLFSSLSANFYSKSLFADANIYCKTCEICQKTKIDYQHKTAPLHPQQVPETLGSRLAIDHKVLTRTTAEGNTAVLVVVETSSGFLHFIAVKDQTALTTAKALVHNVLPLWGTDLTIISDKGPAFTSLFLVLPE